MRGLNGAQRPARCPSPASARGDLSPLRISTYGQCIFFVVVSGLAFHILSANVPPVNETELTIPRPDDWHVHFRDAEVLPDVVPATARRFGRAIVMPNLNPPVRTTVQAIAYRERVLAAIPDGVSFEPLMTLYLHDDMPGDEIHRAVESGLVYAVKLYPAGATTHSDAGVSNIDRVGPALEAMQAAELPLLVHGEVVDPEVDVFDREQVFIDRILSPMVARYPGLRVVLEHITTAEAVQFVRDAPQTVAATITAHHLLLNRNALFAGGLRPHHYCLPVLKRETHRRALIEAAVSADPKFFLGTDSAPHPRRAKETDCGCAGMYTAFAGIELYAQAFESAGALERLENFASQFGARFYRLEPSRESITLRKRAWSAPAELKLGADTVVPFNPGGSIEWMLCE